MVSATSFRTSRARLAFSALRGRVGGIQQVAMGAILVESGKEQAGAIHRDHTHLERQCGGKCGAGTWDN